MPSTPLLVAFLTLAALSCNSPTVTSAGSGRPTGNNNQDTNQNANSDKQQDGGQSPQNNANPGDPTDGKGDVTGDQVIPPSASATMALTTKVGLRTFAAINATMASLTGIAPSDPAVAAAYGRLSNLLPDSPDARTFVASHQVAIFKLATEYCNALITAPGKLSAVVGQDLPGSFPDAPLDDSTRAIFAKAFARQFWGSNLDGLPPTSQTVSVLSNLMMELQTGKTPSSALTAAVVTAACTATLSAAPVLIH